MLINTLPERTLTQEAAMVAKAAEPTIKIELQVSAQEHAAATAIAAKFGLQVEQAMQLMLRRFVEQRGLPDYRAATNEDSGDRTTHGVSLGRLSEIAQQAGAAAVAGHVRAGRLSAADARPAPERDGITR